MKNISPNKKLYISAMLIGWLFIGISIYLSAQSFYVYIDAQFSWFSKEGALNIARIALIAVIAFVAGLSIELAQKYSAVAMGYNETRPRDLRVARWMFALAVIANVASMTWGIHNQVVAAELAKLDTANLQERRELLVVKLEETKGEISDKTALKNRIGAKEELDEAEITALIAQQHEDALKKEVAAIDAWAEKEKRTKVRYGRAEEKLDIAFVEKQKEAKIADLKAKSTQSGGVVSAEAILDFRKNKAAMVAQYESDINALKVERDRLTSEKLTLQTNIRKGVALDYATDLDIWKKAFYISLFIAVFTTTLNYWLGRLQLTIEREERRAERMTSVIGELDSMPDDLFGRQDDEPIESMIRDGYASAKKTAKDIFANIKELSEAYGRYQDGKLVKVTVAETGLHSRDHAAAMEYARENNLIREDGNTTYFI